MKKKRKKDKNGYYLDRDLDLCLRVAFLPDLCDFSVDLDRLRLFFLDFLPLLTSGDGDLLESESEYFLFGLAEFFLLDLLSCREIVSLSRRFFFDLLSSSLAELASLSRSLSLSFSFSLSFSLAFCLSFFFSSSLSLFFFSFSRLRLLSFLLSLSLLLVLFLRLWLRLRRLSRLRLRFL